MGSGVARVLAVGILGLGVVVWLALTVYPFGYGRVESAVLVGVLVLLGFVELVLDDAFAGE